MERTDIDFSRGDEDIAFINTKLTDKVVEQENAREQLLEELEKQGLELNNANIIGIFKHEVSVLIESDSEIRLNGETIYP